jgi:hypothetical protein
MDEKVEDLGFERYRLGSAAQFAPLDIEHVIAKPENHPYSLGSVRAGISEGKGKPTLRLNQAHLKDFRAGFRQPAMVGTRPAIRPT